MSDITKFILAGIDDADGDLWFYMKKVVNDNKELYRTLDEFITSRIDKQELAGKLGLTTARAFENWEVKGMKFQRALECAIALKLTLEEANEFLSKYAGMRCLYPASKQEFRLIYVLIYREQLEKQFPYGEKESVREWIDRVFPLLEFANRAEKISEKRKNSQEEVTRVSTKTYLDALMEQNLELIPSLKFRNAGERALSYLDELVKDTPFEKNYGNRSNNNEDDDEKNERKGGIRKELFLEEEKGHYRLLRRKLEAGEIPHRDELIQFALGSTLNLKKEEVDQFLIKSGYEPLMARDIYEGLLLTVYMQEENADSGENKSKDVDILLSNIKRAERKDDHNDGGIKSSTAQAVTGEEQKAQEEYFPEEQILLDVETDDYNEDTKTYVDFQIFVSEKVDEAIEYLPEVDNLLREIPQWYLNKQERAKRMEKRYFSDMITKISEKMTRTWKLFNRDKLKKVSASTFRKSAANDILILKRNYLDKETYRKVLDIICRTEAEWIDQVNRGILVGMTREEYMLFFNEILSELDSYYRDTYALKKKRSDKKGQSGGKSKK